MELIELGGIYLKRESHGCSGSFNCLFLVATTMTCATLVTGLPVAFTFTYIFEPMKKSAHEMSIRIAGIPKPIAQLTLDCTYTMRVKDTNWAKV